MGAWDFAKKVGRYIPGVAQVEAGLDGNWQGAVNPFQNVTNLAGDAVDGVVDVAGNIKDAYTAPFDEKRRGYDAVAERAEQIKQERMARKDKTYAMAEEKYRPTREALAAVYGDPKSWKL